MPYSPKAASTPTFTTPNLNTDIICTENQKAEQSLRFLLNTVYSPQLVLSYSKKTHQNIKISKISCNNQ